MAPGDGIMERKGPKLPLTGMVFSGEMAFFKCMSPLKALILSAGFLNAFDDDALQREEKLPKIRDKEMIFE